MVLMSRCGVFLSFLVGLGTGAAIVSFQDHPFIEKLRRNFYSSENNPNEDQTTISQKNESRESGNDAETKVSDAVENENAAQYSEALKNDNITKPSNAPESCPGVGNDTSGKVEACAGCPNKSACASGQAPPENPAVKEIGNKLANCQKKILILSGKGGVGKSTVAAQLAWELQRRSFDVGLLDVDVCGPSIPRMMGVSTHSVHQSASGWSPVYVEDNLAVMSIGFLLPEEDDPIIWRGPKKSGLIRQFFTDVNWGPLDFLLVDTPPGTSDEHLALVTYLKDASVDGAIIVTTPQEVALADVRKEINFCRRTGISIIGVVENMTDSVFVPTTGGAKAMCEKMGVPLIGSIPLNADVTTAGEKGMSVAGDSNASASIERVTGHLLEFVVMPERRTVVDEINYQISVDFHG